MPATSPDPSSSHVEHLLLRGSRVGRGFHDHRRARAQVPGQGPAGGLDAGQIGQAVPQRRGDRDHGDVEAVARVGIRRRPEPPRFQRRRELAGGHVLDVGFPGLQPLHPDRVGVIAGHLVPGRHGPHRQRQAHVSQAGHHHGAHRHPPAGRHATHIDSSGCPVAIFPPRPNIPATRSSPPPRRNTLKVFSRTL